MVDGKPVKKKQQTATVPTDYSGRAYDRGGLRPRFLKHARGTDVSSPMYVYRWEIMAELIERFKDWAGDPHEAISIEYVDPLTVAFGPSCAIAVPMPRNRYGTTACSTGPVIANAEVVSTACGMPRIQNHVVE